MTSRKLSHIFSKPAEYGNKIRLRGLVQHPYLVFSIGK